MPYMSPDEPRRYTSDPYSSDEPKFSVVKNFLIPSLILTGAIFFLFTILRVGGAVIGPLLFFAAVLFLLSLSRTGRNLILSGATKLVTFGERLTTRH